MLAQLLIPLAVLGLGVWVLAIIGALSIAQAIGSGPSDPPPPDRLLLSAGDIAGADIRGLPRVEGSARSEYRQDSYDGLLLTEVEYLTDASVASVRRHYRDVFDREGWTIVDVELFRGEWTYTISAGDRKASLEIERIDGLTEIEVELDAPIFERGSFSDR